LSPGRVLILKKIWFKKFESDRFVPYEIRAWIYNLVKWNVFRGFRLARELQSVIRVGKQ